MPISVGSVMSGLLLVGLVKVEKSLIFGFFFLNLRDTSIAGPHFPGSHLSRGQEQQFAAVSWVAGVNPLGVGEVCTIRNF